MLGPLAPWHCALHFESTSTHSERDFIPSQLKLAVLILIFTAHVQPDLSIPRVSAGHFRITCTFIIIIIVWVCTLRLLAQSGLLSLD